jgi:hypothetical protein
VTNIYDKGNIYILDTSEPKPCVPKKQQYLKRVFHTPNSDTSVIITKPKIKLTRKPPTLNEDIWDKYNKEFENTIKAEWNSFKRGSLMPEQFVSDLNSTLASFLESKEEFQVESKQFFQHNKPNKEPIEKLRLLKIKMNKKSKLPNASEEDISLAKEAVRAHSHALKVNKEKEKASLAREEEKAYNKNFWKTAKEVTNGTFGETESSPTFTKTAADNFYKEKYETPVDINLDKLSWFPKVEKPTTEYNLAPYKPKDIKNALRNKNLN